MLRGLVVLVLLVTLVAVAAELYLRSRARSHWRQMEAAAERELLGGGLQGLLRARAMALGGAAVADDDNAAATVALSSAMLTSAYGLEETNAAVFAADAVTAAPRVSPRAHALALASHALVELAAGHGGRAEASARESVALGHKQSSPLFALGLVRLRQGQLTAAAHALQAALVREPGFMDARVASAEVWRELGQPVKARELLSIVLRRTPDHGRAVLLMAEDGELASSAGGPPAAWETTCARDERVSPFIAATCDLARAERAWHRHDRDAAVGFAIAAGTRRPAEPRSLGRAAQLLASLGAVDQAAACLGEGVRLASPTLPSLAWAKVAVALGRGQLADPPKDVAVASSPWAPVLLARIALASGGPKALAAALAPLRADSPEVETLAALVAADAQDEHAETAPTMDPVAAYLRGLQARLSGKPALAATLLAHALHGHGDACRAAGEYVAVLRELGRVPDASAFTALGAENGGCVNLAAALAASREPKQRKAHRREETPH